MVKRVKHKRKNKKHFFYSKLFLIGAVILFVLLLSLAFIEFVNFEKIKIFQDHEEQMFVLEDDCSMLKGMGLVHQIRDEDDCSIRCTNQCNMNDLEKIRSEFVLNEMDCNLCNCYCE